MTRNLASRIVSGPIAVVLQTLLVTFLLRNGGLWAGAQQVVRLYGNETAALGQPYVQLWPQDMWAPQDDGSNGFSPAAVSPAQSSCSAVRVIFTGTSVSVYGRTLSPKVTLSFTLDGDVIQPLASANAPLLASVDATDSPSCQHVFLITVSPCSPSDEPIMYFDYADITVSQPFSQSCSRSPSYSFTAEDANQGPLTTGQIDWSRAPSVVNQPYYTDGSSGSVTLLTASSFSIPTSLSIIFRGTGIDVNTFYISTLPLSTANVTVDGVPQPPFQLPSDLGSANDTASLRLAHVSSLYPGWHALDLTTVDASQAGMQSTGLTFAFATVTGSSGSNGTTSTPSPLSSSSTSTGAGSAANDLQTPNHVAQIAGGVVGGVAFFSILAGLVFLFLHHRQSTEQSHPSDDAEQEQSKGNRAYELVQPRADALPSTTAGSPPHQLRAQRAGLGPMLEEKIRDRDALEAGIGFDPNPFISPAAHGGRFEHVPDWRDAEIDRLRSNLGSLHTTLHERHASLNRSAAMGIGIGANSGAGGGDDLPGYHGGDFDGLLRIDEKARERDAFEGRIGGSGSSMSCEISPSPSSTHQPQRFAPDWRDDELKKLRVEISQLHTALGMVEDE